MSIDLNMKKQFAIFTLLLAVFCTGNLYSQLKVFPNEKYRSVKLKIIHSDVLDEDRRIFVHSPMDTTKTYPVIYLLDGELIKQYTEAMDFAKNNPHIVVGIETVNYRNRDMIPAVIESRPGSGGSDKFLKFMLEELMPKINSQYRSNGENILYGASNAGLFTIYAMLTAPEHFFAFISSCATIGHCPDFMADLAKNLKPGNRLDKKILYIHYGKKDPLRHVTDYLPGYCDLLKKEFSGNLEIEIVLVQNGRHVPPGGIRDGLKFIYKKE